MLVIKDYIIVALAIIILCLGGWIALLKIGNAALSADIAKAKASVSIQNGVVEQYAIDLNKSKADFETAKKQVKTKWQTIYREVNQTGGNECDNMRLLLQRF